MCLAMAWSSQKWVWATFVYLIVPLQFVFHIVLWASLGQKYIMFLLFFLNIELFEMPPIPVHVHTTIFPSPNLSIASFLCFPFPSQLLKSSIEKNIHLFWSSERPNVFEFSTKILQHLPIPSASVLSELEAAAPLFQEKSSMVYTHLPNAVLYTLPHCPAGLR